MSGRASELPPGWSLAVEESTALHWVATSRDVVIAMAYPGSQDDVGHVLATARALEHVRARYGGASFLFVPPQHAKPPSAEVRAAIARLAARLGESIARAAVVVPGTGFGAAVHRGATTGVLALVRPRFPVKVLADLRAGLAVLVDPAAPAFAPLLAICEERARGPAVAR